MARRIFTLGSVTRRSFVMPEAAIAEPAINSSALAFSSLAASARKVTLATFGLWLKEEERRFSLSTPNRFDHEYPPRDHDKSQWHCVAKFMARVLKVYTGQAGQTFTKLESPFEGTTWHKGFPWPDYAEFKLHTAEKITPFDKEFHFADKESASISPLAESMFDVPGVDEITLGERYIIVKVKDPKNVRWLEWLELLHEIVDDHVHHNRCAFTIQAFSTAFLQDLQYKKIYYKICDYVYGKGKEIVEGTGATLSFVRYNDGLAEVLLTGKCSQCSEEAMQLVAEIEDGIKKHNPIVKAVKFVTEGGRDVLKSGRLIIRN